ncbi:MAG: hypothetical protein NT065_06490 [Chlamydiae bacterium]|nr:hypothetical protein [Chlamydiota bacterium]
MTYKKRICSLSAFRRLLQIVQDDGYALYGPKVHNEVIVYDRLFSEQELQWKCEQSVRNYDPCISCSAHFLKLEKRYE